MLTHGLKYTLFVVVVVAVAFTCNFTAAGGVFYFFSLARALFFSLAQKRT